MLCFFPLTSVLPLLSDLSITTSLCLQYYRFSLSTVLHLSVLSITTSLCPQYYHFSLTSVLLLLSVHSITTSLCPQYYHLSLSTVLPLLSVHSITTSLCPQYYHFSLFSMSLNELLPGMDSLPPTDSRLRPDIRCMEDGKIGKLC